MSVNVKPVLGEWLTGNLEKREELVLFRAHKYLLAGEDPPFCIWCHQTLTLEHIFLHCVEFNNTRNKLFNASTLMNFLDILIPKWCFNFYVKLAFIIYFNVGCTYTCSIDYWWKMDFVILLEGLL